MRHMSYHFYRSTFVIWVGFSWQAISTDVDKHIHITITVNNQNILVGKTP